MRGRPRSDAQAGPRHGPALAGRPLTWLATGVVLTLGLRAPWGDAALGRDEAGLAFIVARWSGEGAHAYGEHFIDRPPLLLAAFRLAHEVGGPQGIRVLGALAAVSVVITTTLPASGRCSSARSRGSPGSVIGPRLPRRWRRG